MTTQDFISKYKKYSTSQLELLSSRTEGDKKEAINQVLSERYAKKGKPQPKEIEVNEPEVVKAEPVKKEKKERKKKVKKNSETAIINSDQGFLQKKIDVLPTLTGDALTGSLELLKENGLDIEFIPFLNKGDIVKFQASTNSKWKGETFEGVVTNTTDRDRNGKVYCKVKVQGKGTFQKQQVSVTRIELSEE